MSELKLNVHVIFLMANRSLNDFVLFLSTITYVVGTLENFPNEKALSSTQNKC